MTILERNELILKYMPLANKIANKFYFSNFFEDIKSSAYVGLVDAACKFKTDSNCSFFTYASFRISGEIKDFLRRNKKFKFKNLLDQHEYSNNYFEHYNNIDLIEKSMSFLDADAKKIVKMYYLENVSMKNIGKSYGVSESRISQLINKFKKTMRKNMKSIAMFVLQFLIFNFSFAQDFTNSTPIPVPFIEEQEHFNSKKTSPDIKNVSKPELADEFKNLVWNKWDTDNFIILSIENKQGIVLKNKIESIKKWIITRWGFTDINLKSDCKIVVVPNRNLLKKLFKLDAPKCEVRKDADKILLSAIWISDEDIDQLPYILSEICFSEIEQKYKRTLPLYVKKGMCYLNKNFAKLDLENTSEFTYEKLLVDSNPDEKQCAVLCLLLRKEYGQDNFLKYAADQDIKNFSIKNKEDFENILNRYYKNLIQDLKENKVPQNYLEIKRR